MKTTLKTKLKNNILTIIAIVMLAGLSWYSTYKVSELTTELEDLRAGWDIYVLKSDFDDLNERHEKLWDAFYSLLDTHDKNVAIYNDAIESLNDDILTIRDILKKIINNYY